MLRSCDFCWGGCHFCATQIHHGDANDDEANACNFDGGHGVLKEIHTDHRNKDGAESSSEGIHDAELNGLERLGHE